ncbi:hypothetical protein LCGC14_0146590 [marine sediment metagenome]|uniref:Uncharacterized protein n=1 Tax=marine sediment metagenome TaxID=412755 RepID=A0A0F9VFH7_9ZZZZ
MANNYLQFSEEINKLTDEEKEWLKIELEPPEDKEKFDKWVEERGLEEHDVDCWPDFDWQLKEDTLWVYAEESGNPNSVSELFQKFLATFRPEDTLSLHWAAYCSKLHIGEFNGGSFIAHSKGVEWSKPASLDTSGVKDE